MKGSIYKVITYRDLSKKLEILKSYPIISTLNSDEVLQKLSYKLDG